VTQFEPITAAHFDQSYNNDIYYCPRGSDRLVLFSSEFFSL